MFSSIQMMADAYSPESPKDLQMALNNLKVHCDLWQLEVIQRKLNQLYSQGGKSDFQKFNYGNIQIELAHN